MSRLHAIGLVFISGFSASCGKGVPNTDDAGHSSDEASVALDAAGGDAIGFDTGPFDTGPSLTYVDGGNACDAAPVVSPNHEVRTCCNGQVCEGACVLMSGASAPVCYCVGQVGGCPEPAVCCVRDGQCKNPGTCTGGLP